MLEFGNKEFRNLQEQVGKNQEDILELKQSLGGALPEPIPGPTGETGPQGNTGPQGPKGNSIYGVTAHLPSTTGFQNGDFYLLLNGDLYEKAGNIWIKKTNLRGPQGIQGPDATDPSEWEQTISEFLQQNGNVTEVGGNMEVDGYIKIADATSIIDANGEPVIKDVVINWGDIVGTLSNQTDLWGILSGLAERIDGKKDTYVISIESQTNVEFDSEDATIIFEGENIDTLYPGGLIPVGGITPGSTIYVVETDIPDRWCSGESSFSILETQKVDLTNYPTKSEMNTAIAAYHDSTKQDVINDLETIKSGAAAGATAVQPATLNNYSTTSQMNAAISAYHDSSKQDVISDLQSIRSGAALGTSAVQPATLNNYSTTAQMNAAITNHHDATKLNATKSAVASVGGLVIPSATPTEDILVGIDTSNGQQNIALGENLSISNGRLNAAGGGGIEIVENLPVPSETLYNEGKLYLQGNDLYYCGGVEGEPTMTGGVASLPSARTQASAAAVGTNIYVFGGDDGVYLNKIVKYDTVAGTCTTLSATLPTAIGGASAAAVGTNVYIFGGQLSSSSFTNKIVKYDTVAGTCTTLSATLPSGSYYTSAAAVGTNVYIFGGQLSSSSFTNKIVKYDTVAGTCTTLSATLPTAVGGTSAVAVGTNVYIFGGQWSNGGFKKTIVKYDTVAGTRTTLSATLPTENYWASAAAVGTNIYVIGGRASGGYGYDTIVKYDTVAGTCTTLSATLPSGSYLASAAAVGTNIYVFGGYVSGSRYQGIDRLSVGLQYQLNKLAIAS